MTNGTNATKPYNMEGFNVGDNVIISYCLATVENGKTTKRERKLEKVKLTKIGKFYSDCEKADGNIQWVRNENIFSEVIA